MANNKAVNIKKLVLMDGLGLAFVYDERVELKKNETHWVEVSKKSPIQRHPDLDTQVDKLKIHVARIFGILAIGMYKPEADMTDREKKLLEEVIGNMEIIGITYSGTEEHPSVVISAKKYVFGDKQVVAMVTPNIHLGKGVYEYEHDLQVALEEVREEAFEYIFKRKYAQLDLFDTKPAEQMTADLKKKEGDGKPASKKVGKEKTTA